MTSLRAMRPTDLFRMNLTNLDPLTENYNIDYYMSYLIQWPSLLTVAEDQYGNIVGYMIGKVEEDSVLWSFDENYMPWHGHVTALSVAPQARRIGLAQALTNALEQGCEKEQAWFVDLFVREGNDTAVNLYEGLGYTVYRRVVDYYSDNPTGNKAGEDAFDMRKSLSRDKDRKYVREDGRNFRVDPEDIYHG